MTEKTIAANSPAQNTDMDRITVVESNIHDGNKRKWYLTRHYH